MAAAATGVGAGMKKAPKSAEDVDVNMTAVLRKDYGLPAWNLISGNLPVMTKALHRPKGGGVAGPTAYEIFSGNLPPISFDLLREDDKLAQQELQPGWMELTDAPGTTFWWNRRYRTRRFRRPAPNDDGRYEEMPYVGPKWVEEWDPKERCHYYVNMETAETMWELPPAFATDGVEYAPQWVLRWDFEHSCVYYFNKARSERREFDDKPEDFDGRHLHEAWVFMTRKQILDEQQQKAQADANDRCLGIRGSKRYSNPVACEAALRPVLRTSERIIEKVGQGDPEEVFYVNSITGDVSSSAPPPPPPEDVRGVPTCDPPPAPPDAGNYEPPPTTWKKQLTDYSSLVKKSGGGTRMFGSVGMRDRWLVLRGGKLAYYKSMADVGVKPPQKNMFIDPLNYTVDAGKDTPRVFQLVPILSKTQSAYSRDNATNPKPERVFTFECLDEDTKRSWLTALGELDEEIDEED